MRFNKPVLYVPGNHEFYGSSIDGARDELKRLCDRHRMSMCSTTPSPSSTACDSSAPPCGPTSSCSATREQRAAAKDEARRLLRDFSRIRAREASAELFTPDDSVALFRRHAALARRPAGQRP